MTTFINNSLDAKSKKLARKYKVNPKNVTCITLEMDSVVIEYLEYFKNDELAFCQKQIYRREE